ncbi:hypothetical protein JCM18899A_15760 [Nocardioides sp. AN3]
MIGTREPIDLAVVSTGYAPVKGTAHRPQDTVRLTATGAVGDRGLALVDPEAHRVLRTIQNPRLLTVLARRDGDVLEVTLDGSDPVRAPLEPTGETITCDYWGRPVELSLLEGPHAEMLGKHLGRSVRLTAAPPAAVVYNGSSITIVGTASLRDLAERVGRDLVAESARFRATMVVETDEPYVEETWLGRELRAGDAALVAGVAIPRCAVIDHSPVSGEKDARLLQTLASYRPRNSAGEPAFGIYAAVTVGGTVAGGTGPTG